MPVAVAVAVVPPVVRPVVIRPVAVRPVMIGPVVIGPMMVPSTTRLASDVLLDLWQAVVVAPAVAMVALAWYGWHCHEIHDAVIRVSVDDALLEEVLDEVPVLLYLLGPGAIVYKVIADVLHPHHEVGAGIPVGCLTCVEVMVAAEPWKPMVSATAPGPTSFIRRTGLLTASQLRRELAPKVCLNVVHPALCVVAREHSVATCQVMKLTG